jgi:hypothetical protein
MPVKRTAGPLWKQLNVTLGFMGLQNAAKRFFSGLQIFITWPPT